MLFNIVTCRAIIVDIVPSHFCPAAHPRGAVPVLQAEVLAGGGLDAQRLGVPLRKELPVPLRRCTMLAIPTPGCEDGARAPMRLVSFSRQIGPDAVSAHHDVPHMRIAIGLPWLPLSMGRE